MLTLFNDFTYLLSRRKCYIVKDFLKNLDDNINNLDQVRNELINYDREKRYLKIDRKKLTKKENKRSDFLWQNKLDKQI